MLLSTVESADCRKMLMNALTNVQRRCPELNECLSVILDLNANDSKWVNQPDFDKRLDAYKKIKTLATEGKIDLDFGLLILHNCFYVVRCVRLTLFSHFVSSIGFHIFCTIGSYIDFFLRIQIYRLTIVLLIA